jgi:hypothetical protein
MLVAFFRPAKTKEKCGTNHLIPGDAVMASSIPDKEMKITVLNAAHIIRATAAALGNHTATTAIGSGSRKIKKRSAIDLQVSLMPMVKLLAAPTTK